MKKTKIKVAFQDQRGLIKDLFYKEKINHVAHITTKKKGVIRGNHYHKKTTQYMYITKGSLEYWYKKLNSKGKAKMKLLKVGDLIETPPNEMHALKIGKNGNEFIVFTVGKRGGKDYENDTYRFTPSLVK